MNSAIELVAIDLDGTLLNDAKEVSRQTAAALACLPSQGVKVVIASAQPPRSVRHIYRGLGLDTWQINYNGALIWDEPGGRAVFHRPMESAVVSEIAAVARRMEPQVLVSCEILDRWYTDRFDASARDYLTETARLFQPDYIGPISSFCNQPITKLLLMGPPAITRRLEEMVVSGFSDHVAAVRSDDNLVQIMHRDTSKGEALRQVAGHYGVSMDRVMAIGDALNDMDMLEAAGVAVAMDNAHPRLKEMADWTAPSNNDHGVHAALVRYGLCENK